MATALVGVCLGLARFLGVVLAANTAILAGVYFGARRISRKAQAVCIAVSAIFCALPWCSVNPYPFIVPGSTRLLPQLEIGFPARKALRPLYELSAVPVTIAADVCGDRFANLFYIASRRSLRPFSVFVFWFGILLALLAAALVSAFCATRKKRHDSASRLGDRKRELTMTRSSSSRAEKRARG